MKRVAAALAVLLAVVLAVPVGVLITLQAVQAQTGGFGATIFRDDFTGTALSSAWSVFNGDDPNTGPRAARNVSVHDGVADLAVAPVPGRPSAWGGWAGASMCACRASVSLYGRYQVRAMSTTGDHWRRVALTWPDQHPWPPELDLLEATSTTLDPVTTHYPDPAAPRGDGMQHGRYPADLGSWHTYGVEWTPTSVVYTYDGAPQVTHTGHVPTVPMWLGLTAAMPADHTHPAAPQHYLIDWVQVDAYTPGAACTPAGSGATLAAAAARAAGFPVDQLATAVAVAGAESGYDPTATHLNSDGSTDYGLWQINSVHGDLLAAGDWRDPLANARMALAVYQQAGNSWTPWTTYQTGAYRKHLEEAVAAVQGLASDPAAGCTPGGPIAAPTAAAAAAIRYALAQVGKPYEWGGDGPDGFDCSGLTMASYAAAGITLDRTSRQQWYDGPHVPQDQLQPGDLVFWAYDTSDPATIHHVAIYLGDNQIVAAPYTGQLIRVEPMYFTGYIGAVRPSAA